MEKSRKVTLVLSTLYFLTMLYGCKDKNTNEVEVKDEQGKTKVINIDDLEERKITFEPGEHIIYFQQHQVINTYNDGWGNGYLDIPEVPEGYEYAGSFSIDNGYHGHTSRIVYVFVNNKTVEATASYNELTKKIEYHTPGVVVDTLELTK